jgi:hypothetical protein
MEVSFEAVVRSTNPARFEQIVEWAFAPDLILVFRGSILRCSKGDLRAEVRRVVWHEVAHWLGYETEEQVKALVYNHSSSGQINERYRGQRCTALYAFGLRVRSS